MRLPKKASRHESAHLRIKQVTLILQGLHMQAMTNHFKCNAMPCWYFAQGWLWNQLLLWKFSSWLMCWSYKTIIIANGQAFNQIYWQSSIIKQLTLVIQGFRMSMINSPNFKEPVYKPGTKYAWFLHVIYFIVRSVDFVTPSFVVLLGHSLHIGNIEILFG
jgi:hypothetical protein